MKCIDFDARFSDYLTDWMQKNAKKYRTYDDMEDAVPEVYETFLATPADWLGGALPGEYFEQFDDASMLVRWLLEYHAQDVPAPDMLLNRISELGRDAEIALMPLVSDETLQGDARMTAVTLLRELGSALPMQLYVDWQITRESDDELCDNALESLEEMGETAVPAMLAALDGAGEHGREALLSVLCRYPGDERILTLLLELFAQKRERMAVLAGYLGRLGDERALPALIAAARDEKTGYLDYIEVRAAIEELGGDAPERKFDETDPAYDALQKLQ